MKKGKLFVVAALMLAVMSLLCACGEKVPEPAVKEGSFPFSITYTLNGETGTLSDTLTCKFVEAGKTHDGFYREWEAVLQSKGDDDSVYKIMENELGTLYIDTLIDVRYFMADPFYTGTMDSDVPVPKAFFSFSEEEAANRDNAFAEDFTGLGFEFEIVSWDYPQPIENEYK